MLTDGLAAAADLLACPRCRQPLAATPSQLRCPDGHAYDLAKQGYANLLAGGPPEHADTAAMVAARTAFLAAGHYDQVITELPIDPAAGVIIDAGAGPGSHLARVLDERPGARGLAIDISVPAVRRAARAHPRIGAVVADVWTRLPVRDAVADTVLVVFAPRNFGEFARVLGRDGQVIIVTPGPDHLRELVDDLGLMAVAPDKNDQLQRRAHRWFEVGTTRSVRYELPLSAAELAQVVLMGPNAFHVDPEAIAAQLARTAPATVTVSCTITALRAHRTR